MQKFCWFGDGLVRIWQKSITWTNDDHHLWWHIWAGNVSKHFDRQPMSDNWVIYKLMQMYTSPKRPCLYFMIWEQSTTYNLTFALSRTSITIHLRNMRFRKYFAPHNVSIAGTLGCVFIDNETHESGVTKCTTGEAWSAFSWHHSSVFHCQWTHNQVFLLLSHMLI